MITTVLCRHRLDFVVKCCTIHIQCCITRCRFLVFVASVLKQHISVAFDFLMSLFSCEIQDDVTIRATWIREDYATSCLGRETRLLSEG